ncbi:hypothetical protein M8C21_013196 [Ambrosia artemisiifolia]|uniref:C3H1-type domain-containing protein n=1 Tax=Ambrosia artemisiifolia TaxID=4212 RepID=A0AAD5CZ66_AMBAR|nr:hypothetical protein M8C21_013196 [Ambrosia artemisiifolia]
MLGKRGSELRIGCSRTYIHNIRQIDWACPPRFLVDPDWKMEAGSESQETHIQLQRESRIADVIYYHKSDIPPNPYVAPNAFDLNDDSGIPVIPLEVINDETSPNDPLIPPEPTVTSTRPLLPSDEVIGTAVALVALIKSKEPGSQIDLELLIQLLCNPGILEKLTKEHGLSANQSSVITRAQPRECSSVPLPVPMPAVGGYSTWFTSTPFSRSLPQGVRNMIEQIHSNSESQNPSSNRKVDVSKLRKLVNEYGLGDDLVKRGPAVVKDADYYRRLISQHGMSQENDKPQESVKLTASQEQRPCVYFNSPKGCRRGSGCRFQHVKGGFGGGGQAVEEQHGAKRMKLSGRNFGRHT